MVDESFVMLPELTVLFDAECSFCQNATKAIQNIDRTKILRFIPLQDPWVQENFPEIPPYQFRQTLHAIDANRQVYTGAKAYAQIGLRISPTSVGGLVLRLYAYGVRLPGMLPIAEWVYSKIANNRSRWFPNIKL